MKEFEKLGIFYLGREYDLAARRTTDRPVLYESRDLVTHAVCVGMTGSGKTGLCIGLLEEAALDGVPVIAIDPKGDLGNLLLAFSSQSPDEFRPWIDEDEARRAGQSPDAFAADQAKAWREGLEQWGQDAARIQRLRDSAEFTIYTPGSRAGASVSVLASFAAPAASVRDDLEAVNERATGTATSVLSLAGVDAGPRSREHTLVSTILATAWQEGKDVDFRRLIEQVQSPPFQKLGVLDLESVFPRQDRFELSLALNGLLAAPGFDQWFEGEPLSPGSLLWTAEGKPRVSIFSISHLNDTERMFFVSLLLNQVVGWMRTQSGTTSLRAILYMDEIAGYFPPVANPASKGPLLTLLKQARAFGIGVVLATQNPVDLDYKGLGNTGTWFLGRLQTERDKGRVLDGLEGAAAGSIERAEADRILSSLGKRVFLLHNVHDAGPTVFQTRWTMSYLRGPLSKDQIKTLTLSKEPAVSAPAPRTGETATAPGRRTSGEHATSASSRIPRPMTSADRPVLPPGIEQYYLPDPAPGRADLDAPAYVPVILGAARVTFADAKLGIDAVREVICKTSISDAAVPVDWQEATTIDIGAGQLRRTPERDDATYVTPPAPALEPSSYQAWSRTFSQWLMQSQRLELLRHRETKLTSRASEDERDFRLRVRDAQRQARDAELDAVRKRFGAKREALVERIRKAEAAVRREEQQASQQKTQTVLSAGAALLGAFLGRKAVSAGTLGRATTTARGVGRSMKEAEDVKRAAENVRTLLEQLGTLDETVNQELQAVGARYDEPLELETVALAPRRGQVTVHFVALGWDPR